MNAFSPDMKLAIAYADSMNPLLEAILNPKLRFDSAADRREDGLAEAKEIQQQTKIVKPL